MVFPFSSFSWPCFCLFSYFLSLRAKGWAMLVVNVCIGDYDYKFNIS